MNLTNLGLSNVRGNIISNVVLNGGKHDFRDDHVLFELNGETWVEWVAVDITGMAACKRSDESNLLGNDHFESQEILETLWNKLDIILWLGE